MDEETRRQIFATKEKLHQLTQTAVEEEQRSQARLRREKEQAEDKAREEKRYLRRHNKTVAKVLSQAAKADRRDSTSGEEETEEEGEDDSDKNQSEQEALDQHSKNGHRSGDRLEAMEQPTASTSTGKSLNQFICLSLNFIHMSATSREESGREKNEGRLL